MNNKIKSLEEFKLITPDLRAAGKKIVHCHGIFYLLYIDHIKYFNEARSFGEVFMVTITLDESKNILNCLKASPDKNFRTEVLSSFFAQDYSLRQLGDINLWVDRKAYNFVEIFFKFGFWRLCI